MAERHVAIVGAGIAGLTTALCLARIGIVSTILEQAPRLDEIGAGVQLSPNATRILGRLGLADRLEALWREPASIALVSGLDLKPLARVPVGPDARRRWGAPYAVLHRADLQRVLLDAARRSGRIRLIEGQSFRGSNAAAASEQLSGALGATPELIIGADGVWSNTRLLVAGGAAAPFTGQFAWRLMLDAGAAARCFDPGLLTAFLGPSSHLVAYPLKARGAINLVAIAHGEVGAKRWEAEADGETALLKRRFGRWSPRLTKMFDLSEMAGRWPIHAMPESVWRRGDIVLVGDAAHAMPPYAAQGAAMAIEDAWTLALCLHDAPDDLAAALDRYVAMREPRIDKVRRRAAFNRFAYHASGPVGIVRDLVLALRSPESLAADFDWLYGQ